MGARGPRPKPTAVLVREGNKDVSRRRAHEPKCVVELPPVPGWMSEPEKDAWEMFGGKLLDMGVVTGPDSAGLELLVASYVRWRQLSDFLTENGETYTTKSGAPRTRPEARLRIEAARDLLRLLREYGLTPAARPDVHTLWQDAEISAEAIT